MKRERSIVVRGQCNFLRARRTLAFRVAGVKSAGAADEVASPGGDAAAAGVVGVASARRSEFGDSADRWWTRRLRPVTAGVCLSVLTSRTAVEQDASPHHAAVAAGLAGVTAAEAAPPLTADDGSMAARRNNKEVSTRDRCTRPLLGMKQLTPVGRLRRRLAPASVYARKEFSECRKNATDHPHSPHHRHHPTLNVHGRRTVAPLSFSLPSQLLHLKYRWRSAAFALSRPRLSGPDRGASSLSAKSQPAPPSASSRL